MSEPEKKTGGHKAIESYKIDFIGIDHDLY